jgi:hypothetical protein
LVERSEWVGLVLAQPCVEHSLQKLGGFAITALAAEWFAQRSIKIATSRSGRTRRRSSHGHSAGKS